MSPAVQRRDLHSRRIIGTALLLAIFLFPLHFHSVNPLPLINKDRTCYAGTKIQHGLIQADSSLSPVIQAFPIAVSDTYFLVPLSAKPHASRAPPIL